MIAGFLMGLDMGEVGVWASIGPPNQPPGAYPDLSGRILAVDGLAQEFSEWPDADATDAAITLTTHGIAEAKDCLSG
jgi:hypothetical protein